MVLVYSTPLAVPGSRTAPAGKSLPPFQMTPFKLMMTPFKVRCICRHARARQHTSHRPRAVCRLWATAALCGFIRSAAARTTVPLRLCSR